MNDEFYAEKVKKLQELLKQLEVHQVTCTQNINMRKAIWIKMQETHSLYLENWKRLVAEQRNYEKEDVQLIMSLEQQMQEIEALLEAIEVKKEGG